MRVHVEGNLYITSDERCFMLVEARQSKDAKTEEVKDYDATLGYFTTLQGVCKAIVTRKVKESTAEDLKSLIGQLEGIQDWVERKVLV